MAKLFVVIVTFNSERYIKKCLGSLRKARVHVKMVVVDNGSTDGTVDKLKSQNLKVKSTTQKLKVIQNRTNLGFARGSNVGIKYALAHGATHVMLLNPDTVVSKNFLKPLLENNADIVGPVGGRVNFLLGRPKHIKDTAAVDFISGACMLVKREVFEKIGLFDERFFLYFEDVDFCLRAKRVGFSVRVAPESQVVHQTIVGTKKPISANLHLLASNFIFINHWVPLTARPFAYFYWFLLSSKIISEYILRWIFLKN